MHTRILVSAAALAALSLSPLAIAETFNYELQLGFDDRRESFTSILDFDPFNNVPIDPPIRTDGFNDTDAVALTGTWYFQGLDDSSGPRARAAFLNRASSLSFRYARIESSSGSVVTPAPPNLIDLDISSDTDEIDLDFRYVWKDSGWFVDASLGRIEDSRDLPLAVPFSGFVVGMPNVVFTGSPPLLPSPLSVADIETSATSYGVGAGRYFGASTSVGIAVDHVDADFFDTTSFAASLTHVGSVGQTWQYGVDAGYRKTEQDFNDRDAFLVSGSLYPSPNFEFGLAVAYEDSDFTDETTLGVFASWFVRPNLEFSASYRETDQDEPQNVSLSDDAYSFGFRLRF